MIEKIMSKLGMVVLWCIVIIYGIAWGIPSRQPIA